ncbi:MAG: DUF4386 family protein [Fidelibacterota bacterium]|nr:MAG: DUF4386 family protein [Candidatus Neomarinimicrobiota bacterium]
MLSILPLSDQYAAATTGALRSQALAAGESLVAQDQGTPQTIGFLFIAIAVLIISLIILQSEIFSRTTAYTGIVASVVTFADDISVVIAPSVAAILMPASGVFWVLWWILINRKARLFRFTAVSSGYPSMDAYKSV